jgi:hypothetical protein
MFSFVPFSLSLQALTVLVEFLDTFIQPAPLATHLTNLTPEFLFRSSLLLKQTDQLVIWKARQRVSVIQIQQATSPLIAITFIILAVTALTTQP